MLTQFIHGRPASQRALPSERPRRKEKKNKVGKTAPHRDSGTGTQKYDVLRAKENGVDQPVFRREVNGDKNNNNERYKEGDKELEEN